jgi:hypothetical protein
VEGGREEITGNDGIFGDKDVPTGLLLEAVLLHLIEFSLINSILLGSLGLGGIMGRLFALRKCDD